MVATHFSVRIQAVTGVTFTVIPTMEIGEIASTWLKIVQVLNLIGRLGVDYFTGWEMENIVQGPYPGIVITYYKSDPSFSTLDYNPLRGIWDRSGLGNYNWIDHKFDCDDFAVIMKGEVAYNQSSPDDKGNLCGSCGVEMHKELILTTLQMIHLESWSCLSHKMDKQLLRMSTPLTSALCKDVGVMYYLTVVMHSCIVGLLGYVLIVYTLLWMNKSINSHIQVVEIRFTCACAWAKRC